MKKDNYSFFSGNTTPLFELCDSIVDCHHSTPNWKSEGKLVIRNFNIKNGKLHLNDLSYTDDSTYLERIKRSKPESGDIIITREAPMGEVCMIPDGIEDHRQFILDCGYPQEEIDSYGKYFYVRYWDAEVKDENGSTVS
jgi:type I restriction enzyme S subunit